MASQSQKFSKFGQAFISYGSYHYDTVNKIIHIICVPLIAATLLSLLSFIPYTYTFHNLPLIGAYTFGAPELFWLIGIIYYLTLNPLFAILIGSFSFGASILWKNHFKDYSTEELFYAVLIIQIVAWGLQFVGHGVFEKRKPALLDNITQILNAPLFVLIELCQMLGLKTKQIEGWKTQIKKNVEQFRSKSEKAKST